MWWSRGCTLSSYQVTEHLGVAEHHGCSRRYSTLTNHIVAWLLHLSSLIQWLHHCRQRTELYQCNTHNTKSQGTKFSAMLSYYTYQYFVSKAKPSLEQVCTTCTSADVMSTNVSCEICKQKFADFKVLTHQATEKDSVYLIYRFHSSEVSCVSFGCRILIKSVNI